MDVYKYIKKSDALRQGGKRIGVRWVDVDKGTKIRSRLVAQEFAKGDVEREDLFAGTPPLGATKFLLSDLASNGSSGTHGRRLMVLDIKRAFLYGAVEETIFVELPDEDPMKAQGYMGQLQKAMYGTRAAPVVWQKLVVTTMEKLGFTASKRYPCIFFHPTMDLKVVTHVDDFLCAGPTQNLKWLRDELTKEFDLTSEVLGPGREEVREAKFLGRKIEWRQEGLRYSGDAHHAEVLIDEWAMHDSRPVVSPGTADEKSSIEPEMEKKPLNTEGCRVYRRAAARLNYMAQDRADLAFAAKETARSMANPTEADNIRLKRVLRYLRGAPTAWNDYVWQPRPSQVTCFTDSDWAGCAKSRKSTSGGCIVYGSHLLAHWSSTQATIALSVGEAELNAIVKGGVETLGVVGMFDDFGLHVENEIKTDSSAASGIAHRQGVGKLKHLENKQLWIQGAVSKGRVRISKIPRAQNHADALTHHWLATEAAVHFPPLGLHFGCGSCR